jgi:hypothetical protein
LQKKDNTETEVLVLAFGDDVATILFLVDEEKDGCVECVSKSLKWVNPRMLNWTWGGYLMKCVKKLDAVEFKQIQAEVERVLSVKVGKELDSKANHVPDLENSPMLEVLGAKLDELQKLADARSDELSMERINHGKCRKQLQIMKEMYSELMEKYLKRA